MSAIEVLIKMANGSGLMSDKEKANAARAELVALRVERDDAQKLRASVAALTAERDERARQLSKAREIIEAALADTLKPQHLQQPDIVIPAMRQWLSASTAPAQPDAPQSETTR